MKYICLAAFISGILFTGCSYTEGKLELKGKILDKNTNVTIPNKAIFIIALVKNDDKFIYNHVAGHFYTDSSGCFAYTLRKVKNVYLYDFYIVGDSAYAFSDNRISLTELNRNGRFLSFYLNKLTDLTIKIDRKSKTPYIDTLYISWKSKETDGRILYPYQVKNNGYELNKRLEWIGGNINSAIKTKVYADEKTIVRFKLFRDGKYMEVADTIFCSGDIANRIYFKY